MIRYLKKRTPNPFGSGQCLMVRNNPGPDVVEGENPVFGVPYFFAWCVVGLAVLALGCGLFVGYWLWGWR